MRGTAKGWIGFSLVLLVVNGGGAALVALVAKDPLVTRAVWTSAVVAAGVQLAGFACAKLAHVIAGSQPFRTKVCTTAGDGSLRAAPWQASRCA